MESKDKRGSSQASQAGSQLDDRDLGDSGFDLDKPDWDGWSVDNASPTIRYVPDPVTLEKARDALRERLLAEKAANTLEYYRGHNEYGRAAEAVSLDGGASVDLTDYL